MKNYILSTFCAILLSACNIPEKLSSIGDTPPLTNIQDPTKLPNYEPVQMPMPQPIEYRRAGNTLWEPGSRAFFKDQRAGKIGDIVTINVSVNQKQAITMSPDISRKNKGSLTMASALGLENKMEKFFPKKQHKAGESNPTWMDFSSNPSLSGSGSYNVSDAIQFKMAAHVIQVLPNGNMVVQGRQEIRLVDEVREIELKGIVRREDIGSSNSVSSDKIAEMRISYGGRGELSDMQRFPWGQQILNKVMPF